MSFEVLVLGNCPSRCKEIEVSGGAEVPGIGEIAVDSEGKFSLGVGIGKIAVKVKNSPDLRSQLRQYLEP
ncbi:MAG: ATP-binding protein, partial [Symploca sp. SIO3E6]|nr:ATP-binding protein [Caldora sp. SIO3E6]